MKKEYATYEEAKRAQKIIEVVSKCDPGAIKIERGSYILTVEDGTLSLTAEQFERLERLLQNRRLHRDTVDMALGQVRE